MFGLIKKNVYWIINWPSLDLIIENCIIDQSEMYDSTFSY